MLMMKQVGLLWNVLECSACRLRNVYLKFALLMVKTVFSFQKIRNYTYLIFFIKIMIYGY